MKTLCAAVALPEGSAPEWLHLLPAGTVRTADGRGPYRVGDATALMSAFRAAGKVPIDENHATDLAAPKGAAAPARGWIVELQSRADGIWGRVEWTGAGRRMMEDREYRGVSPVIRHDASGAISAILRASLTNTPNLAGLTSLHSQDDFRAELAQMLGGVSAAASDDALIVRLLHGLLEADNAEIGVQLAELLGSASTSPAEIVASVIQRLSPRPVSYGAVLPHLRLLATEGVAGVLKAASTAPATPPPAPAPSPLFNVALQAEQVRQIKAGIAALRGKIEGMAGGSDSTAGDGLTAADLDMIGRLGLDRADYARARNGEQMPDGLDAADAEMIRKLGLSPAEYATAKRSQVAS